MQPATAAALVTAALVLLADTAAAFEPPAVPRIKRTPGGAIFQEPLAYRPPTLIAQPTHWGSLPAFPRHPNNDIVDESGAAAMYMWLLVKGKGCVPPPLAEDGVGRLVCSGPLVVPTPASCATWLKAQTEKDAEAASAPAGMHQPLADTLDEAAFDVSASTWRRQALLAGFSGGVDTCAGRSRSHDSPAHTRAFLPSSPTLLHTRAGASVPYCSRWLEAGSTSSKLRCSSGSTRQWRRGY